MKIGYARVSTAEQNLDLQISALEKAGCTMIFKEKRSAIKERPELDKMMNYLREGDTVVVWKLDRLARSLQHLLSLIEVLKKRKIGFISLSDNISTETHLGEFFLQISGAFSQLERNLIIERTKAGLQAARERGIILGRKRGLDEVAQRKAKAVYMLYIQGDMTVSEICDSLGISTATVYRYLDNAGVSKKKNYGRKRKNDI